MTYLNGKCLIATPGFEDDFFKEALIYICSHNKDGALGFVINKPIEDISFQDIAKDLVNIDTQAPNYANILNGGPLDKIRGFVLHSTDYMADDSIAIDKKIAISSSLSIISDIAKNQGPKKNMVVLGHASWSAGQLEEEIKNNFWQIIDCDDELLFNTPIADKRLKAFERLGLSPERLSPICGHA